MVADTRQRLLAVERILLTTEQPLSINDILAKLQRRYDIDASQSAIYSDIAALTLYYDIEKYQSKYKLEK
mgnify:CR=1 FL=1